ncbi:hypothetical protein ACROYT_G013950 [Oculina patagonica]
MVEEGYQGSGDDSKPDFYKEADVDSDSDYDSELDFNLEESDFKEDKGVDMDIKSLYTVILNNSGLQAFSYFPDHHTDTATITVMCGQHVFGKVSFKKRTRSIISLKLGYSVKKCITTLTGKALREKDDDLLSDQQHVEKLIDLKWNDCILHHSLATLQGRNSSLPSAIGGTSAS